MQQRRRRRIRWWTALAAAIVVIGAMLSVTHVATAEEEPDALALAARNPQRPGARAGVRRVEKGGTCTTSPTSAMPTMGGPANGDFIDIRQVRRAGRGSQAGRRRPPPARSSRSAAATQNGHHNSDNFIVAPGVTNGAHHTHDYVGNLSTDGFSTNESLAAAGTTCRDGDQSDLLLAGAARTRTPAATQAPTAAARTATSARS